MEFWLIWEEICKVMSALCFVTALAAAVSAGILLIREKLTERLSGEWAAGSGRRTMILTAAVVCIWILVIGQSAFAAEVPEETASEGVTAPSRSETEFAAPIEPGDGDGQAPMEPGDDNRRGQNESGNGDDQEPEEPGDRDEQPPVITIEMEESAGRDSEGIVYCRNDNAGIRVTIKEDREEDSRIASYQVSVTDPEGNEIRREGISAGKEIVLVIDTEEIAAFVDGLVLIRVEASDEAGNAENVEYSFVLDTEGPVLTAARTYRCNAKEEILAQGQEIYDDTDLYYNDERLITRLEIEDSAPVTWTISCMQQADMTPQSHSNGIARSVAGSGIEGSMELSEEGVYSIFVISGEDIAGNHLRMAADCSLSQDLQDLSESPEGFCSDYRKVLDRTPPEGEIRIKSKARGYAYGEEMGAEGYYAADVSATLCVKDLCGDKEIPSDEDSFKLRMQFAKEGESEETIAYVKPDESAAVREDGTALFGAYGKDRAGNPLTVKEVFDTGVFVREGGAAESSQWKLKPSYAPDSLVTGQGAEADCIPFAKTVRDTINPTLSTSISRPSAHPAGEDRKNRILYYGSDPAYYPNGVPEITVQYIIEDLHSDADRITFYRAFAPVQDGMCCEEIEPRWERDSSLRCKPISVGGQNADGQQPSLPEAGQAEKLFAACILDPGRDGTPDGVYRFGIEGRDKAGNPLVPADGEEQDALFGFICADKKEGRFETGRKVIDTIAPSGKVTISDPDGKVYCRLTQYGTKWIAASDGFMPFRREKKAIITFSAEDMSPVSAACRILSTASLRNDKSPDGTKYCFQCGEKVWIRGEQIFRIERAVFEDRAGNRSAMLQKTVNFYLDTHLPKADIDAPTASVRATTEVTMRTADQRSLYSGEVTLEVEAEDPEKGRSGSGLREVACSVRIAGRTVEDSLVLYRSNEPAADPSEEKTPRYHFHGTITIPSGGQWECNDIVVTVTAVDNAGNRSDPEKGGTFRLGIDSTRPRVSVRYTNNDVRNGRYFGAGRKALIQVRERNFSPDRLRVNAPYAEINAWTRRQGKDASGNDDIWSTTVTFAKDGAYTLDVAGSDALGNPAVITYEGEAVRAFTVDRTPPRIEVVWDNTDVRNGKYFNRARNASIRITDLSFDERQAIILPFARSFHIVTCEDSGDRGKGDTYEMTVPFTEDGTWQLRCMCTDLAGNTAAPVTEPAFVIDTQAPWIVWDPGRVKEMGAYKESLAPVLRFEDANPCYKGSFAHWYNLTAGGRNMCMRGADGNNDIALYGTETGAGGESGETVISGSISLADPPLIEDMDGICVLAGTVCDLAGNRSYARRNVCVNRFGSVYDLSQDAGTMAIISDYYTDAGTPFIVTEYNVSPLTEWQVTLYRNGIGRTLTDGKDYTVTESRNTTGMKYTYRIDPSAFQKEGIYKLLLQSKDAAEGINRSPGRFRFGSRPDQKVSSHQDDPGYSPEWAVDRTPPAVRITGADLTKRRFVADHIRISVLPSDNIELKSLTVKSTDDRGNTIFEKYFNQKELRAILSQNHAEIPVRIEANEKWQTIHVTAEDGAGNCSDEIQGIKGTARILVNTNMFVHLYRSGVLQAAAFLALIALIRYTYGVYKRTLA